jgi:hypothetical protein
VDVLDLEMLTDAPLSAAERNRIWLAMAHEVLMFDRLGVVAPQTTAGAAMLSLARTVADARGFRVAICELPPVDPAAPGVQSGRSPTRPEGEGGDSGGVADDPLERAAVRCWSRFAREVDALLVVPDAGLRPELVRRLNRTLRNFGVPAFALARELDADLGLTMALVASGIDLDDPQVALRFNGVLRGLRVHALNRQLANLPAVSADLGAFAELGIRPDPRLMTLVSRAIEPDLFIAPVVAVEPDGSAAVSTSDD